MPDQITTKPFSSRAQWRWAFANDMPFARRWARETPGGKRARYRRLPRTKAADGVAVLTEALVSTLKASGYGARAGQQIAGRLYRGGDGKFTSGAGGESEKPSSRDRSAARRTARQERRDTAAREEDAKRAEEDAFINAGKTPRERALRRRQVAAARRERTRARNEAERQTRAQEDADEAAARAEDEAQPKGGGGGGGSKKPSEDEKKRQQEQKKRQTAAATASQVGLAAADVDALRTAAETGGAQSAALARLGLIDADGSTTDQGRRALTALERGDVRQYRAALQDAQARMQRERERTEREQARETARAQRDQDRQRAAANREQVRETSAQEARERRTTAEASRYAEQQARREEAARRRRRTRREKAASFRVFKDARGQWRWVAFSSTAYRDRDGEIVSTKALAADVARADATGQYGPLRWWHVPGLDLGDTDFNALDGRVLIESGTFKTERIARIVAAKAGDLEISLGFLHPPNEPDSAGVFHSIRRFERSLTPRGKASNLFTRFSVKEHRMLDATKRAALKALGFADDEIAGLEQQAAATQKTADDAGVAYKAADEPRTLVLNLTVPAGASMEDVQATLKSAVDEAFKAVPPVEEEAVAVEEMAEPPLPDDGMGMEGDVGGLTLSPEDGEFLRGIVREEIAAIVGALQFEQKMRGMVDELKGAFGGYQTQKDSEAAEQRAKVNELAATVKAQGEQLADLNGVQPPAVSARASARDDTIVSDNDPLVQAAKSQQPAGDTFAFADMRQKLFGPPPAN